MQATIDYQRILIPIDFSDCSRKAFYVGLKYAAKFDADTVLLHVRERSSSDTQIESTNAEVERVEDGVRRRLDELFAKGGLDAVDRRRVTIDVRGGKPWVEIVRYTAEESIDLVVMGTHGTTGLRSMLIGSQCEKVVRRSSCHVLAVKPDGFDATLQGIPEKFRV